MAAPCLVSYSSSDSESSLPDDGSDIDNVHQKTGLSEIENRESNQSLKRKAEDNAVRVEKKAANAIR